MPHNISNKRIPKEEEPEEEKVEPKPDVPQTGAHTDNYVLVVALSLLVAAGTMIIVIKKHYHITSKYNRY